MYVRLKLVNESYINCRFDKLLWQTPSLTFLNYTFRCSASRMCNSLSTHLEFINAIFAHLYKYCVHFHITYVFREYFFGLFGWFYLSPNLFISAWCSLESSRVHTQITYFRGLDIGTERVVFILFWCFKLRNFISSIQFTCIKCGIRKCKIDVCMYF